jgi:hypothetical protein
MANVKVFADRQTKNRQTGQKLYAPGIKKKNLYVLSFWACKIIQIDKLEDIRIQQNDIAIDNETQKK